MATLPIVLDLTTAVTYGGKTIDHLTFARRAWTAELAIFRRLGGGQKAFNAVFAALAGVSPKVIAALTEVDQVRLEAETRTLFEVAA